MDVGGHRGGARHKCDNIRESCPVRNYNVDSLRFLLFINLPSLIQELDELKLCKMMLLSCFVLVEYGGVPASG